MIVARAGLAGMFMGLMAGVVGLASPATQAQEREVVRCESHDGRFNRCEMPWRDARLVRQESDDPCERGRSWGVDRDGLWVDRGCRGLFGAADRDDGWRDGRRGERDDDDRDDDRRDRDEWRPGPDWDREIRFKCESNNREQQFCQVDVGRHGQVYLVQQLSNDSCEEGYSWGWNRAGVWVSRGCRGLFSVQRRW